MSSDDWRNKAPIWATTKDKKIKWGKAKGAGATKLEFDDEDYCDGFLEGKFPAPSQPATTVNMLKIEDGLNISVNGISYSDSFFTPRSEKVDLVFDRLNTYRLVWFKSSAGSGKTAFTQLVSVKFKTFILVAFSVEFRKLGVSAIDYFQLKTGIDLNDCNSLSNYELIVIDDAQNIYNDLNFWHLLIKVYLLDLNLLKPPPTTSKFIVNSTYSLNMEETVTLNASPDSLVSSQVFGLDFLKLSDYEENLFFQKFSSLRNAKWLTDPVLFQKNKSLISADCGHHVGILKLSCIALLEDTKNHYVELIDPYLFSCAQYERVFLPALQVEKAKMLTNEHREILQTLFLSDNLKYDVSVCGMNNALKLLVRCGILTHDSINMCCSFVCPAAQRILFRSIFPNSTGEVPDENDLFGWVQKVISKFSLNRINKAFSLCYSTPLEDLYQKEFYLCVANSLHPRFTISPELQIVYNANKITGRLDFYINSVYRWGVELLREGKGASALEHYSRFQPNGTYYNLNVRDFVVIDFSTTLKCCEYFNYIFPPKFVAVVIYPSKMEIRYGNNQCLEINNS